MSHFTGKGLYLKFHASKVPHPGLGDVPPTFEKESVEDQHAWNAIAAYCSSGVEAPKPPKVEPHTNVTVVGSHLPADKEVHPKTGVVSEVKK